MAPLAVFPFGNVCDPALYPEVLVTAEPGDGNPDPSGKRSSGPTWAEARGRSAGVE